VSIAGEEDNQSMKRLLVLPGLALLVAACSGNGAKSGSTAPTTLTTTATTLATTTTEPTSTTARPKLTTELGKTKPFVGDDGVNKTRLRIGVLAYSDNATLPSYRDPNDPRPGYKYVAIEVRTCAVYKNYPDDITVNWETWSLDGKDGTTIEPSGSYSPDTLIAPLYPDGKVTPIGTCRKGWIPFEVPTKWKPDFVEYNPGDGQLTWRL
jgi:hypothetical protein